jgi:alpha-tubulin suppressor-like RCC1 family protein
MKKVTFVHHPLGLWLTVASAMVASACTPQIRTQLRSFASLKTGLSAVLTWSGPTSINSGSCESYTVTNEVSGIPISLTLATTVNLALQGTGTFFSDPSCSIPVTTATIAAGSSSVSVYFSAASPQTLDLEASSSLSTADPYAVLIQGAATQLAFSTEPSASEASGVALGIQPTVQVEDSLGHLISSATNAITLAAFTDSGCTAAAAGTLAATTNPLSASSGVASFGGVTYTGANGTIYLQASAAGLTSACSSAITIGGTATKLAFSTEPSASENSGTALGTQPVVQIQDSSGTLVTTTSNAITLAAFTDVGCTTPASGTFAATTNPLNASSGTATFGGVTYTGVDGTIYIGASASGLTSACSSAITISAGTALKLAFGTEPSATENSGTALGTQPVVNVEDTSGNLVSSATNAITLAAFTDSSCTAAATGTFAATTNPLNASSGSATFGGTTYTGATGTIYIRASASGLTSACSSAIVVSAGSASKLIYSTEPSATENSGTALGTQPILKVEDASGNLVSSATNAITLAAFTDVGCTTPASGTFAATTNPLNASSGTATFGGVTYTGVDGTIYIGASASGLTSACSSAIVVSAGASAKLVFSTEPSATENSGTALSTQPVLNVEDSSGNLVSSASNAITLAAFTDIGCTTAASGTLAATTNPLNASSGTASFGGVTYTGTAGTIYIKASASGLTATCSSAILVRAGSASKLIFTTEPSASESSGTALSTQPVVQVEDSSGNFVSSATNPITLAAYTDIGCTAAAAGTFAVTTNPLNASSGTATFSGVTYTGSGTIYIKASTSGLTSACSSAIVLGAGAATQLAFSTEPSSTESSGVALATQPVVQVEDSSGTLVSSATNAITLAAFTNVGCTTPATGTFSVTTNPLNATSGAASFAGVTYTGTSGTTLYIQASASGLTSACSSVVTIGAGTASKLVFSTEPSPIEISGVAVVVQPTVLVEDSTGNTVTSASNSIALAAYTDSGCTAAAAGTLGATTNPLAASSGTANFAGVTYTGSGIIYLKASTSGLASACSTSITLNVKMVSAGNYGNVCALTGSGSVYCWGDDTYGEVGYNNNIGQGNVGSPIQVLGVGGVGTLSDIYSIASGSAMACGLSNAGNVYCWGYNDDGELGNNSTTQSAVPVEVTGVGGTGFLSNIISISAGDGSVCALNTSGNVYCWGYNSTGELGNNSTTASSTPVEVKGVGNVGYLSGITSLGVGGATNCAVSSAGNVYCWGEGTYGQLGDNSTSNSHVPVEVMGVGGSGVLSGITGVTVSDENACAVASTGIAYCWGHNQNGEVGNNTTTQYKTPVQVLGVNGTGTLAGITAINTQLAVTCALSSSGNIFCWGENGGTGVGTGNPNGLVPQYVLSVGGGSNFSNAAYITAGTEGGCAVSNAGNVYCWGQDSGGSPGATGNDYQTAGFAYTPVEVYGVMPTNNFLTGISSLGAGVNSACAVVGGEGYCWGGSIGNVAGITSGTPMAVAGVGGVGTLSGLSAIYPLQYGGCAMSSAGNAYCWGDNSSGELGNGSNTSSNTPVEVADTTGSSYLSGITAISGGWKSSCALAGGHVYCWGSNADGQLGNGTSTDSNLPVEVTDVTGTGYLSNIVAIGANGYSSCALSSTGNVYCWGDNSSGQLGNNSTTEAMIPVEVLGVGGSGYLSGIASLGYLGAAFENQCAVSTAGNVYCWGANNFGQLGNGTTTQSFTPVEVVGEGGAGYLSGIASVSTASDNTCAVTASAGDVYCWGSNSNSASAWGDLGDNSTVDSSTPVQVVGVGGVGYLTGMVEVTNGGANCALSSSGESFCWGINYTDFGQGSIIGNDSGEETLTPEETYAVYTPTYLQL